MSTPVASGVTQLAPGVWSVTMQVRLGLGMSIPARTVILARPNGGLVVISPTRFDAPTEQAIDALGRVELIVAPNGFHHLFARKAAARWPEARVLASKAIAVKQPDLEALWLDDAADELAPGIRAFPIRGMPKVQEWVFWHEASRTLVVADLFFNLQHADTWLTGLALRAFGTYKRFAMSRFFLSGVKDGEAFAASVAPLLDLPLERLVVGHGEPLDNEAAPRMAGLLRAAMARFSRRGDAVAP